MCVDWVRVLLLGGFLVLYVLECLFLVVSFFFFFRVCVFIRYMIQVVSCMPSWSYGIQYTNRNRRFRSLGKLQMHHLHGEINMQARKQYSAIFSGDVPGTFLHFWDKTAQAFAVVMFYHPKTFMYHAVLQDIFSHSALKLPKLHNLRVTSPSEDKGETSKAFQQDDLMSIIPFWNFHCPLKTLSTNPQWFVSFEESLELHHFFGSDLTSLILSEALVMFFPGSAAKMLLVANLLTGFILQPVCKWMGGAATVEKGGILDMSPQKTRNQLLMWQ